MNVKRYTEIFDEFKLRHSYLIDGVEDWGPIGRTAIRVNMKNGTMYDFDARSNSIRNVKDRPMHHDDAYDEDEWREVFADRLAEMICTKRLNQQSLADYTGLSKGAINNYINKRATPSGYALTKLARALDCSIMDLTD
mgnify:CR=1 FL=1